MFTNYDRILYGGAMYSTMLAPVAALVLVLHTCIYFPPDASFLCMRANVSHFLGQEIGNH